MKTPSKCMVLVIVLELLILLAACGKNSAQPSESKVSGYPIITTSTIVSTPISTTSPTPAPDVTAIVPSSEIAEPSPVSETEEPESLGWYFTIPDKLLPILDKAKITEAEYQKITVLICSALSMDSEFGPPSYFNDTKKISSIHLVRFLVEVLDDLIAAHSIPYKEIDDSIFTIDKSYIENILYSAFHIQYKSGYTGDDLLTYVNGIYTYTYPQGSYPELEMYKITWLTSDKLMIQMNVTFDIEQNFGNTQAILQKDKNSLFGFYLISLKKIK